MALSAEKKSSSPITCLKSVGTTATSVGRLTHIGFQLFIEHGLEETTIDDIAQAAGIGRRHRMTLMLTIPSPLVHANLRYAEWRQMVGDLLLGAFAALLDVPEPPGGPR